MHNADQSLNQVENEVMMLKDQLNLSINQAKEILMGKILDRELVNSLSSELDKLNHFISEMAVNQSWCLKNVEDNANEISKLESSIILKNESKINQLNHDHPLVIDWKEMIAEF